MSPVSPKPCNSTTAGPLPPMRTCSVVPFDGMSRVVKLGGNGGTCASPVDDSARTSTVMIVILSSMWPPAGWGAVRAATREHRASSLIGVDRSRWVCSPLDQRRSRPPSEPRALRFRPRHPILPPHRTPLETKHVHLDANPGGTRSHAGVGGIDRRRAAARRGVPTGARGRHHGARLRPARRHPLRPPQRLDPTVRPSWEDGGSGLLLQGTDQG